jgi:hypothetical protein
MNGKLFTLEGCSGDFVGLLMFGSAKEVATRTFCRVGDITSVMYHETQKYATIMVRGMPSYTISCELKDVHDLMQALFLWSSSIEQRQQALANTPVEEPAVPTKPAEPRFNGKAFAHYLRYRNKVANAGYKDDHLANVEKWTHAEMVSYYNHYTGAPEPREVALSGAFNDREEYPDVHRIGEHFVPRSHRDTTAVTWQKNCARGMLYTTTKAELIRQLSNADCWNISEALRMGDMMITFKYVNDESPK